MNTQRGSSRFFWGVLLLLSIALWLRGIHHVEVLAIRGPGGFLDGMAGERGGVLLALTEIPYEGTFGPSDLPGAVAGARLSHASVSPQEFQGIHDRMFDPSVRSWKLLGFHGAAGQLFLTPHQSPNFSALLIPYWVLVVITGPPAIAAARRQWRDRLRARQGLCIACGYDLRASSGQCPECGTAIGQSRRSRV